MNKRLHAKQIAKMSPRSRRVRAILLGLTEGHLVVGTPKIIGKPRPINELSMSTLASAVAKTRAIKTQFTPSNVAWAQAGLKNQYDKPLPTKTTAGFPTGQVSPKGTPLYGYNQNSPMERTVLRKKNALRDQLNAFRAERNADPALKNKTHSMDTLKAQSNNQVAQKAGKGNAHLRRTATNYIGDDKDAVRYDGNKTVNNSQNYWKYRDTLNIRGPEMDSIVQKV